MENLIAKLLGDFEDGKLSRRQLIQTLALCATAPAAAAAGQAPAASASAAAAGTPAPWKTVYLDHISYAVTDYKKSAAFYSNLMGWTIRNDNGTNQATLDIGNVGGIIIRNARRPEGASAAPAAAAPSAQPGQPPRPPVTGVVNHISYGIAPWNTDTVKAELERRGLNPRPDMVGDNFKSFHVFDPDGWDLQISNKTSSRD